MAKFKVHTVKYSGGASLSATLEGSPEFRKLTTKADRNKFLKLTSVTGATWWRNKFLPLRFTDRVKGPPWNYHAEKFYKKRKDGTLYDPTPPMVSRRRAMSSKDKSINAAFNGRVTGRAKGGRLVSATVGIPMGHEITVGIGRAMNVVPPSEVEAMVREIEKRFAAEIAGRIITERENKREERRVKRNARNRMKKALAQSRAAIDSEYGNLFAERA